MNYPGERHTQSTRRGQEVLFHQLSPQLVLACIGQAIKNSIYEGATTILLCQLKPACLGCHSQWNPREEGKPWFPWAGLPDVTLPGAVVTVAQPHSCRCTGHTRTAACAPAVCARCAQPAQTPAEHKAYSYIFPNNYMGSVISSTANPLSCS